MCYSLLILLVGFSVVVKMEMEKDWESRGILCKEFCELVERGMICKEFRNRHGCFGSVFWKRFWNRRI